MRALPMLALAAAAAVVTVVKEQQSSTFAFDLPLRPLVAAAALWFYLGKLVRRMQQRGVFLRRWKLPPGRPNWRGQRKMRLLPNR